MKKYKHAFFYFLAVASLLIGTLPVINLLQFNKDYDFKKLFNTDLVERYVNYSFYKLFNISLESNSVIAGDDGFLFLGNRHENVLRKSQGLFNFSKEDMIIWTDKLKAVQQWYESRGIQFVFVIAPNKHSVYYNKMASWSRPKSITKTITDVIVDISKEKNINLLDLRDVLIDSKEKHDDFLYLKTDSHWNGLGASIAYEETISFLNNRYNMSYKSPGYSFKKVNDRGKDLAKLLKIAPLLADNHEASIWFDFDKKYNVCLGHINKKTYALDACKMGQNISYGIVYQPQYTINNQALNNMNALILCDSFGRQNSQLYSTSFKNIWKFHYQHINAAKLSSFVSRKKPDVVIYQVVERALYNQHLVSSLPEIQQVNNMLFNTNNVIFDLNNLSFTFFKNEYVSLNNNIATVSHADPIIILRDTRTRSKLVVLKYNVDSSIATVFQLFYKDKETEDYSESRSYSINLKKGNNNISVILPAKYINNQLRVDLVSSIGRYKVNNFSIYEIGE